MNPRILIVEDREITAYELQLFIQKQGYTYVETCNSGEAAIEKAKNAETFPHLYIMDIALKGKLDGLETAQEIRNINPNAQFIFISGEEEKINIAKATIKGLYFLLVKPIDNEELLSAVQIVVSTLEFLDKPFVVNDSIFIYRNKDYVRIKVTDISVLKTEKGSTTIFTKTGKNYHYAAGLTTFMYNWNTAVKEKGLLMELQHVSKTHAVNVCNVESFGADIGIKVEGCEEFIPYTKKMCPHFEQIFVKIKTSKSNPKNKNGDKNEDD